MDTFGMYPSSCCALVQSSWRFALAMRMRMGVNSEAAMHCTGTDLVKALTSHTLLMWAIPHVVMAYFDPATAAAPTA